MDYAVKRYEAGTKALSEPGHHSNRADFNRGFDAGYVEAKREMGEEVTAHLKIIMAYAGNPDPAQGCRNVISICKDILDSISNDEG